MRYFNNTKQNALLLLRGIQSDGASVGQIARYTHLSHADIIRLLTILLEYNILYVDQCLVKIAKHLNNQHPQWDEIEKQLGNITKLT